MAAIAEAAGHPAEAARVALKAEEREAVAQTVGILGVPRAGWRAVAGAVAAFESAGRMEVQRAEPTAGGQEAGRRLRFKRSQAPS